MNKYLLGISYNVVIARSFMAEAIHLFDFAEIYQGQLRPRPKGAGLPIKKIKVLGGDSYSFQHTNYYMPVGI